MPNRGSAFQKQEIDLFLDLMEEVLPILSMEWEDVEQRHQEKYGTNDRTKETLKRKFQNLYLKRMPTGDPSCPPEGRRAKKIQNDIKQRADISAGDDSDEKAEEEEAEAEAEPALEEQQTDEVAQDAIDDSDILTQSTTRTTVASAK